MIGMLRTLATHQLYILILGFLLSRLFSIYFYQLTGSLASSPCCHCLKVLQRICKAQLLRLLKWSSCSSNGSLKFAAVHNLSTHQKSSKITAQSIKKPSFSICEALRKRQSDRTHRSWHRHEQPWAKRTKSNHIQSLCSGHPNIGNWDSSHAHIACITRFDQNDTAPWHPASKLKTFGRFSFDSVWPFTGSAIHSPACCQGLPIAFLRRVHVATKWNWCLSSLLKSASVQSSTVEGHRGSTLMSQFQFWFLWHSIAVLKRCQTILEHFNMAPCRHFTHMFFY